VALSPEDGPAKGSHEWQVWAGGGEPVQIFNGAPDARVWTAGVSYGWVLTGAHGPGLLRGRFEWAGDLVPVLEVLEPRRPVYGGGFDPIVWRWNFVTRRRVSPYWEFAGGGLFSNHELEPGGSTFNFTPSMAAGVRLPWGKSAKYGWTAEVRFLHISDGGLTNANLGVNDVEVRIGLSSISHRK